MKPSSTQRLQNWIIQAIWFVVYVIVFLVLPPYIWVRQIWDGLHWDWRRRLLFRSVEVDLAATAIIGAILWLWGYRPQLDPSHLTTLLTTAASVLGTVFALFMGSLLLLYQQVSNVAPNSLDVFPERPIRRFIGALVVMLVADGISLWMAPEIPPESGLALLVALLLFQNAVAVVGVAIWVLHLIYFLNPANLPLEVVRTARTQDWPIGRVLEVLEELTKTAVDNGFTRTGRALADAYYSVTAPHDDLEAEDFEQVRSALSQYAASFTNHDSDSAYSLGCAFRNCITSAGQLDGHVAPDSVANSLEAVIVQMTERGNNYVLRSFTQGVAFGGIQTWNQILRVAEGLKPHPAIAEALLDTVRYQEEIAASLTEDSLTYAFKTMEQDATRIWEYTPLGTAITKTLAELDRCHYRNVEWWQKRWQELCVPLVFEPDLPLEEDLVFEED